jgi:hypothetical protein
MTSDSGSDLSRRTEDPATPVIPSPALSAGERRWAWVVTVVVVVLVALPGARTLVEGDAADGFPLSTYPMFVHDRGRVVQVPSVVAVGPGTSEPISSSDPVERLSPARIAGTDQVVQASVTVRRAIAAADGGDPGPARELCARAAGEVAAPAEVVVVMETYDLVVWADDTSGDPERRREVARCPARG